MTAFNENMFRPCPMLENPEKLRKMVQEPRRTPQTSSPPESVEHLCAKCDQYAENWKPVAEKLWDCFPSGCWPV